MPTLTAARPSVKPARSTGKPVSRALRWLYRHPGEQLEGAVRLAITYAGRTDLFRYWVEQIPSDFGVAFRLTKIEPDGKTGDVYHVNVANAQDTRCDCKGFEAHGHCKHVDCCRAIIATENLS